MTHFDHINIRTQNLAETIAFYKLVLGVAPGYRPPFPFPGAWLYSGQQAVIHVIQQSTDYSVEVDSYFNGQSKSQGMGNLDHVAFRRKDIDQFLKKINSHGLASNISTPPGTEQAQVFLQDPNGITIEMIFDLKTKEEKKP